MEQGSAAGTTRAGLPIRAGCWTLSIRVGKIRDAFSVLLLLRGLLHNYSCFVRAFDGTWP